MLAATINQCKRTSQPTHDSDVGIANPPPSSTGQEHAQCVFSFPCTEWVDTSSSRAGEPIAACGISQASIFTKDYGSEITAPSV